MNAGAYFEGPIPARAGEPLCAVVGVAEEWAYPRSRGGTRNGGQRDCDLHGLSPLARGNRITSNI